MFMMKIKPKGSGSEKMASMILSKMEGEYGDEYEKEGGMMNDACSIIARKLMQGVQNNDMESVISAVSDMMSMKKEKVL